MGKKEQKNHLLPFVIINEKWVSTRERYREMDSSGELREQDFVEGDKNEKLKRRRRSLASIVCGRCGGCGDDGLVQFAIARRVVFTQRRPTAAGQHQVPHGPDHCRRIIRLHVRLN